MLGFALAPAARADNKPTCHGIALPAGSKKVEGGDAKECRYRSSINWDETIKYLEKELPSSSTRWHREVNIPAAKYRHVENTASRSAWEGLNVYQLNPSDPSAEVRLFVIPRPVEKKVTKDTGKKSEKKDKKTEKKKGK